MRVMSNLRGLGSQYYLLHRNYLCVTRSPHTKQGKKAENHHIVSKVEPLQYKHASKYRIAGNFRGRKLSRISRFFRHPRKFSPRNSRHATPIMRPLLTFRESFLREMLLSHRSSKVFSLENFPLYGNIIHNVR